MFLRVPVYVCMYVFVCVCVGAYVHADLFIRIVCVSACVGVYYMRAC